MRILFPDGHTEDIPAEGRTIETILLDKGLNSLEYLISCEGEIVPEDTIVTDTETIQLIRISHGG
ncbi:MAG: thiamine S protein [Methanobacteriota archaeon]